MITPPDFSAPSTEHIQMETEGACDRGCTSDIDLDRMAAGSRDVDGADNLGRHPQDPQPNPPHAASADAAQAPAATSVPFPAPDASAGAADFYAPGMVSQENCERRFIGPVPPDGGHSHPRMIAHETPVANSEDRGQRTEDRDQMAAVATEEEMREAQAKETLCREFQRLTAEGCTLTEAARAVGRAASFFSGAQSPYQRWLRDGLAALLPRRGESGARPTLFADLPEWFLPACQYYYRRLNRTAEAGSVPEAIRRAISLPLCHPHHVGPLLRWLGSNGTNASDDTTPSLPRSPAPSLPECPAELREAILARERDGRRLLPERLLRQIPASASTMRAIRNPRDAWLRYVESPGSLMLTLDEDGIERYLQPGEWMTIDDGTINLCCTVPLERPGDKCFDRWGVMVGRFQFLLVVDHRSYFITGFSYTARPRSSYRAEDLTATMHTTFAEHGRPRAMVLEHGVSAANAVSAALDLAGVKILRAHSPHQKVVEGVFNKLWTKLSLERGQVGRTRGEEEATNKILDSCRAGATDPRRHFANLAEVLTALRAAIADHNSSLVNGRYGRWVPSEFWTAHSAKNLRPLEAGSAWMFSPVITAPLKVRTSCLKTSVALLPGFSQTFAFQSPGLDQWYGARVKLHFNPLAPDCIAKVLLAEAWHGHRAGSVIGDALQIDRQARYTRRLMGYGADPDIGLLATRQSAQALRRVAQSVRPDGTLSAPVIETRDGRESTTIAAPITNDAQSGYRYSSIPGNIHQLAALAEDDPSLQEFLGG